MEIQRAPFFQPIASIAHKMRGMIANTYGDLALVLSRERYLAGTVGMGDGVFGAARVVAVQLRSHIEECGRRYEAQRDEVRATRSELGTARNELTLEIAKLRSDQYLMDDRNQKAIAKIYSLLGKVAWGVATIILIVLGVLAKAQLHIPS